MIKRALTIALLVTLTGCGQVTGLAQRLLGRDAKASFAPENLTRADIEQSGIALIRVQIGEREPFGRYYLAQADNNGTVTYGKDDRAYFVLRGGLLVATTGFGNDILAVRTNPDDPIQNQRPVAQWPGAVTRVYQLPGSGVEGARISMDCRYENAGSGVIEIVEQRHATTLMHEICTGALGSIENSYMVGADGFIWKSEQFAGRGTEAVIIEIVEPLT